MHPSRICSIAFGALGVGLGFASGCSSSNPAPAPEMVSTSSGALVTFSGLFPTGVDNNKALLASGAKDPHYTLPVSADLVFAGPDTYVVDPTLAPLGFIGTWVANSVNSQWISIRIGGNAIGASGSYTYHTTFTLQNVNPATATLSGTWACDDDCSIRLNGTVVASRFTAFGSLAAFNIASGAFVLGTNSLDFIVVNNQALSATGLRVESISGDAVCTNDSQCASGNYCNNISLNPAACESKVANGQPVPGGTCTNVTGSRACVAGVCDTVDDKCGLANGTPCSKDAGAQCRSGVCGITDVCVAPDGGASDGGSGDGGDGDGGKTDGGNGDGGKTDGGQESDGGAHGDASEFSEGAAVEGGGLGCNAAGSSSVQWQPFMAALAALAFLRRKRHGRSATSLPA